MSSGRGQTSNFEVNLEQSPYTLSGSYDLSNDSAVNSVMVAHFGLPNQSRLSNLDVFFPSYKIVCFLECDKQNQPGDHSSVSCPTPQYYGINIYGLMFFKLLVRQMALKATLGPGQAALAQREFHCHRSDWSGISRNAAHFQLTSLHWKCTTDLENT